MKIFKKGILAIVLILIGFNSSAQVYGGVSLFQVAAANLSNGKIKMNSGTSTTIKFRVQFSRIKNSNWYQGSSVQKYLFSNFTIKLSTAAGNGSAVSLTNEANVTSTDFGTDSLYVSKVYEISIHQSSLTAGINIFLLYKSTANPLFNSYNTSYGWVLNGGGTTNPNPGTVTPPAASAYEGKLYIFPDGKVYSVINGLARHVETWNTFVGVFTNTTQSVASLPSVLSFGTPIQSNAHLFRDQASQRLYFAEGSYLRHIVSTEIASKYHFKIHNNSTIYNGNLDATHIIAATSIG